MRKSYPDIYLLRHGQTEWNAAGRLQGRKNSPLTPMGQGQARDQQKILNAAALDPLCDLWCSPLGRTRETADIALAGRKPEIRYDARLREISVGVLEGMTMSEIEAEYPEVLSGRLPFRWHFQAPDGESFEEICARSQNWLDGLSAPTIAVTHGITSRIIRGLLLDLDIDGMQKLPGGQGVVYSVKDGIHLQLEA